MSIYFLGFGWFPLNNLSSISTFSYSQRHLGKGITVGSCRTKAPLSYPQPQTLLFLQGIFPTQESNRGLLHCRWILYQLSYQGSPKTYGMLHEFVCHIYMK